MYILLTRRVTKSKACVCFAVYMWLGSKAMGVFNEVDVFLKDVLHLVLHLVFIKSRVLIMFTVYKNRNDLI